MTRHWLTAAGLAAALLCGGVVAPAEAKIKRGAFTGTTKAGDPIGFKVDRRGKVRSFFYVKVTLRCSDDDSVETDRVQTPRRVKFPVTLRTFGIRASNKKTGFTWKVDGTFKKSGRAANGFLRVSARFDEQNKQDPNGSIACDSGSLSWSARRS